MHNIENERTWLFEKFGYYPKCPRPIIIEGGYTKRIKWWISEGYASLVYDSITSKWNRSYGEKSGIADRGGKGELEKMAQKATEVDYMEMYRKCMM